jgi:tripartite ATP-independent transporter DctM subunit
MLAAIVPLGGLIPPSLLMVVMGSLVNLSIGALFMSGIGPGLLMAVVSSIVVVIYCSFRKVETYDPGWAERWKSIPRVVPALGVPFIVIGGIMTGWATPTEAGGLLVAYCLILSLVKGLIKPSVKELPALSEDMNRVNGMLGFGIGMAALIGSIMVYCEIPFTITEFVMHYAVSKFAVFSVLTIMFVLLGLIGETWAAMLILLPVLMPVANSMGIHPWWICCWYIIMQGLGGITPPVAGGVFFLAIMTQTDPYFIFKRILPWCGMYAAVVALMYIFPDVVTIIPYAMGFSHPPGF